MATVSQIIIQIGDKPIPLTLTEARELRQVLDDLLGERIVVNPPPVYVPYLVPQPYRWWQVTVGDVPTSYTITNAASTQMVTVPETRYPGGQVMMRLDAPLLSDDWRFDDQSGTP